MHVGAVTQAWRAYTNRLIACEMSSFTRYYDRVVQVNPRVEDRGLLLDSIECAEKRQAKLDEVVGSVREPERRTAYLLNGNFNYEMDIQGVLSRLRKTLARTDRVAVVIYNPYLSWLYRAANRVGLREGTVPCTFVTRTDLVDLARLSGFEIVRVRSVAFVPWRILSIGTFLNRALAAMPGVRWLGLVSIVLMRPLQGDRERPSLSVVIPARNERGNIAAALERLPRITERMEVIFVEGNSSDGTWEEIQRVIAAYRGPFTVKAYQQTGRGKNDAVRLGFSHATGDLLTILDADLTMPPEMLGRFYDAYCNGIADFINGSRLVYPMEGEAMRFLNRLGNVFFAKAVSAVLDIKVGDTLCGTKLLARHDYERFRRWGNDFGDFDPFGDFELLFPAAVLGLGIVDVPVAYRRRTYGSTNIRRFRDGLRLLRMVLVGLFRIRAGGSVTRLTVS